METTLTLLAFIFIIVFREACDIAVAKEAAQKKDILQAASTSGDISQIYGVWKGGNKAACAIFGTIIIIGPDKISWRAVNNRHPAAVSIEPDKISWRPANKKPPAAASYSALKEPPGVIFEGFYLEKYVTVQDSNARYRTFLLKLENLKPEDYAARREAPIAYIRVVVDSDPPGLIEFIEYRGLGPKAESWGNFHSVMDNA